MINKISNGMKFLIIVLIIVVAGIGFLFYRNTNQFPLPSGESIEVVLDEENIIKHKTITMEKTQKSARTILETDGVKHSIPLGEILSGGVGKDGIPPIDNPKFTSTKEANEYLKDTDVGLGFTWKGISRFYPYQILVFHEIVNDHLANDRVLVTYCPLCATGIVFDPKVGGVPQEFGVSGKLWQSNLVMYDRKTDSLWSQVLGEAIVGVKTGTKLKILPSDLVRFEDWKKQSPGGGVLSKDTGANRFYGVDPYGDYYTTPGVYFPISVQDDRLSEKEFVLGVLVGDRAKAYLPDAVKTKGTVEDTFAGKNLVLKYEKELDVVRIFEKYKTKHPLYASKTLRIE